LRRNVTPHLSANDKLWTEITNPNNTELVNYGLKSLVNYALKLVVNYGA